MFVFLPQNRSQLLEKVGEGRRDEDNPPQLIQLDNKHCAIARWILFIVELFQK